MYTLRYSDTADRDLSAIFNYIAGDSRAAAVSYLSGMEEKLLLLRDFPELGHLCRYPELAALGMRVLVYQKHLIFYTVDEKTETVNLVRVLHSSRDYRRLF